MERIEVNLTTGEQTTIQLTQEEIDVILANQPLLFIPTEVSMRQARLALFQQDKLSQVQPLIDAMSEPAKTTTQISWDYATIVQRDDDLVVQLSAAMGLTSVDLDALFTLASTL